jgi:hypothetical protein
VVHVAACKAVECGGNGHQLPGVDPHRVLPAGLIGIELVPALESYWRCRPAEGGVEALRVVAVPRERLELDQVDVERVGVLVPKTVLF